MSTTLNNESFPKTDTRSLRPLPCAASEFPCLRTFSSTLARIEIPFPAESANSTAMQIEARETTGEDLRRTMDIDSPAQNPPSHSRCAACDAVIYSRRHKCCDVCGTQLPAHLVFSDSQALQVEQLIRSERQRHREWMKRNAWFGLPKG